MNESTSYQLGPDVEKDEQLHDSRGRLIDDSYVDSAVEDAITPVRGRGRPSLSASGESPARCSTEQHDLTAQREGLLALASTPIGCMSTTN